MKNEITNTQRINLLESCYYEFKSAGYDGLDYNRLYLDIWYDINLPKEEIIKILDLQIEKHPNYSELNYDFQKSYTKEYFDKDTERLNWFIELTQSEYFKNHSNETKSVECWLGKAVKYFTYYENTTGIEISEIRKWIDTEGLCTN